MRSHDAPDSLLVDALACRWGEVHADRRPRRVPALGQKLCVDQHVDLAALVSGERLCELDRRRPAADRFGLEASRPELTAEVVGVLDAGRVDDAGGVTEPVTVEAGCSLVDQLVIEDLGERFGVVVAADDRNREDGRRGRHTKAPEGGDQAAPRRISKRQVIDRRWEDIGDLLGNELLGRGHADVRRLGQPPDRCARFPRRGPYAPRRR